MCLFYESARKQASRQTDRLKPTCFFLLPSLISLVLFFFRHCAVLLFSLRDETQDAALCCLSASNSCTPLPHSLHTSIASFPPLVLPDPCACFLSVHSSSTGAVLSLHLCFYTRPFSLCTTVVKNLFLWLYLLLFLCPLSLVLFIWATA